MNEQIPRPLWKRSIKRPLEGTIKKAWRKLTVRKEKADKKEKARLEKEASKVLGVKAKGGKRGKRNSKGNEDVAVVSESRPSVGQ